MRSHRGIPLIAPRLHRRGALLALLALVAVAATPATALAGFCGDAAIDSGEECDDGNLSGGDGCSETCVVEPCFSCAGEPSFCSPDEGAPCADDGNPCTDDQCTATGVCDHSANAAPCTDGLFCTGADTCSGGSCSVHAGDPCPGTDGDDNCSESCNEARDGCTAPDPNGSPCDDGLFCTGLDFCAGGICSAHTNDPCPGPDGDDDCRESCDETNDSCTGSDLDGSPCDDGLFCTGLDFCAGGTCTSHAGSTCPGPDGDADCAESCDEATHTCTAADPNGSACNDDLYCSVGDGCSNGSCQGTPRDCNAVGDQCRTGVCDEDADVCVGPPKPEGTLCDDGNICSAPDRCNGDGACVGLPDPAACLDNFTCYKASTTSNTTRFAVVSNVTLTDQFRTATVKVVKPRMLCLPTDHNGDDPDAPMHADHLEDYLAKPVFAFTGTGTRTITNQFGTVALEVETPVALQAPTLMNVTTPPGPLPLPAVDHFHCYRVRLVAGQSAFQRFQTWITDRFGTRLVTVKRPRRLCAPANKDGEAPGAEAHPKHLLCYQIKEYSEPRFKRLRSIFTHADFGPETLDVKKPVELCVPSLKTQ